MFGAKIAIWTGAIIAFFASAVPAKISNAIGLRPFPDDEANFFSITVPA